MLSVKYIAFYSYRGGVGKTLSLCNVAARMAEAGDRVLVVDMDFEAPGASVLLGEGRASERRGMLEYLEEFKTKDRPPLLSGYIEEVSPAGSPLRLLCAGRMDDTYPDRVAALDLVGDFSGDGAGERFFRTLRESISALDPPPHYVLVDSRPGMSFSGALSVQMFADEVVLLCGLGRQSLAGLRWVTARMAAEDRLIHYVVSPAPSRWEGYEQEYSQARRVLGKPLTAQLPFDEDVLWRERLLMGPGDRERALAVAYDGLTEAIRSPDDVYTLVNRAMQLLREPGQGTMVVHTTLQRALQKDPRDIRVLKALAHFYLITGEDRPALDHAEKALSAHPRDADVWKVIDDLYEKHTEEKREAKSEIRTQLEQLYVKHFPAAATSQGPGLLVWFSVHIRESSAITNGDEGGRIVEVLQSLAQKTAKMESSINWEEFARRLPVRTPPPLRRFDVVRWERHCLDNGLVMLAQHIRSLHRKLFVDVSGVVARFGDRGYGFLNSDDGLRGIYFNRERCEAYGKGQDDHISAGETAIFDISESDDPEHPWQAKRVRFPQIIAE